MAFTYLQLQIVLRLHLKVGPVEEEEERLDQRGKSTVTQQRAVSTSSPWQPGGGEGDDELPKQISSLLRQRTARKRRRARPSAAKLHSCSETSRRRPQNQREPGFIPCVLHYQPSSHFQVPLEKLTRDQDRIQTAVMLLHERMDGIRHSSRIKDTTAGSEDSVTGIFKAF